MLGRAIRDARERGNFPERVREESDAMLSRLYDAVRQDISAAARRAGPEGEAYVRLSERIDSAYRELMRTVRQPLGRVLGENVDPVAAIGQLVRATQEGGEIRLLRAYFRVAREKGNHALATSLLLHDMTEGGLQGFLRTYRGLSEDARRLMFHGSPGAEALGNRLDMLARAGGRLERFIETARPGYVIDPRRWIGTGNIALGLLYHVSLPALITTAVGMSAASRILASRAFGRWLRHLPVERGPLAREWQSYVQRVRAVLLESLGLNTAAANTVVSYLSPASAHALEPAAGREAPPGMRSVVGKKGAETGRGVHRTLGGDIELPPEPESRRFGKGSVQVGPEREPTGQHNFLWRMLTDPGRHFEERVRYYADNPPRGFVENMNATAEMIGHMGFGPFGGVIPGRGVNIETFIRLFREGLSRDELARRFGISRPRVNSIIRERGLHPPLQQRWATPEVIAQLEQMLGEGLSRRSMAERLGTNVNTIDRLLERSELRVPQTRRRVDPATRPQPPRRPRGDEYVATQTRALIAMEDELRRQGKSAAEIARAINERFREGVTADEIASGQVWWRE
jgi:DNA-binding CsgD family transcriptional regulator